MSTTGQGSASEASGALVESTAYGGTSSRGVLVYTAPTFQSVGKYQVDVDWTPGPSPSANFQQVPALYFFDYSSGRDGSYAQPNSRHVRVELAGSTDNATRTHVRVVSNATAGEVVIKDNAVSLTAGALYHIKAVLDAGAQTLTLTISQGASVLMTNTALDLTHGGAVNPLSVMGALQIGLYGGGQYYGDGSHQETWANFALQGPPQLQRLSRTSVVQGGTLSIYGQGFGASQGSGSVTLQDGTSLPITSWSDGLITATIPQSESAGATTLTVTNGSSLASKSSYLYIESAIDPLFSDSFSVSPLSPSAWNVNTNGAASVSVSTGAGQLVESTAYNNYSTRGALAWSKATFNDSGLAELNVDWTPGASPSGNFQQVPAIYFFDDAASRDSGYMEPVNRHLRVELGSSGDSWSRTRLRVVANVTTGDVVLATVYPSEPFVVGVTHHLHVRVDWSNQLVGVDVDGVQYVTNAAIPSALIGAMSAVHLGVYGGGQYYPDGSGHIETWGNLTLEGTPQFYRLSRTSVLQGASLTIYGQGFGAAQGTVSLGAGPAPAVASWSDTAVTVTIPANAPTGSNSISLTPANGLFVRPAYIWINSAIDALFSDTFPGTSLSATNWSQTTNGQASISVANNTLTESTAYSNYSTRYAFANTNAQYNRVGLFQLNVDWTPGPSGSANFQAVPALYFFDPSASRDGSYGEPTNRHVRVELAAGSDAYSRTQIRVVANGTSGDDIIKTVSLPAYLPTGVTHQVYVALDWTNKFISVAIDGNLYISSASLAVDQANNPTTFFPAIAGFAVGLYGGGQYYPDGGHFESWANFALDGGPKLARLSRSSTYIGGTLTLYGQGFGASQGSGAVSLGSGTSLTVTSWSDSAVTVTIPNGAALGSNALSLTTPNGLTTRSMYLWIDQSIDSLVFDNFNAGTLSAATWSSAAAGPGASVNVTGGTLNESTAYSNYGTRYAFAWTNNRYNKAGLFQLNFDWTPSASGSANFQAVPALYFFDPAAGRDASYGEPNSRHLRLELASGSDSYSRTQLRVVANGSSGDDVIRTVSVPVPIEINMTHQVHVALDWTNQFISVDIDGTVYLSSVSLALDQANSSTTFLGTMSSFQVGLYGGGQYYPDGGHVETFDNFALDGTAQLNRLSRSSSYLGGSLTIYGQGFGASQGNGSVNLAGGPALTVTSWSDTAIGVTIPSNASLGANSLSVKTDSGLVTRSVYLWLDSAVDPLIADDFSAASLNAATWASSALGPGASATTGGGLVESTAYNNYGNRGTFVWGKTVFNKNGVYHFNADWTPGSAGGFQAAPAVYFFDASASRDGGYADPTSRHVRVELASTNDGASRTHLRIVSKDGSSGDQVIRDATLATPLAAGFLHQFHVALDLVHQQLSLDVDGAAIWTNVSLTADQNNIAINPLGSMASVQLGLYGGGQYYPDGGHVETWNHVQWDGSPQLFWLSKANAAQGGTVSIYGQAFGSTAGSVTLTGGSPLTVTSWSDSTVTVTVPLSAPTGGNVVTVNTANGLASRPAALWIDTNEGNLLYDNFQTAPLNASKWGVGATGAAFANDANGYLLESTAYNNYGNRGVLVYSQTAYNKAGLYHFNMDWTPGYAGGFQVAPALYFFDPSAAKAPDYAEPQEKYIRVTLGSTNDGIGRTQILVLAKGAGTGSAEYTIKTLNLSTLLSLSKHQVHASLDFANSLISLDIDGNTLVSNASLLADQNNAAINVLGSIGTVQIGLYGGGQYYPDGSHQDFIYDASFDLFSSSKPTVQLLQPANNAVVGGLVQVVGTAVDALGVTQTELFVDGVGQGIVNPSTYTFTWNSKALNGQGAALYPDGAHALFLRAWNTVNNTGDSTAVNVTVQNNPPVISFSTPPVVVALNESTATFSWSTNDAATGQVIYGLTSGVYSSTFPATVDFTNAAQRSAAHSVQVTGLTPARRYYYRVISSDQLGNTTTSAEQSFITDKTPPMLVITAPQAGSITNQPVTVTYTVSDNFSTASNIKVTSNYNTFSFSNTGNYNVVLTATDEAGNSTSTAVNFTIDTQGPNPVNNLAAVLSSSTTVQLTWSDPSDNYVAVTSCTLAYSNASLNGSNFASATTIAAVPAGPAGTAETYLATIPSLGQLYYFGLECRNSLGNTSSISNVAFLNPQPPVVTIAAPASGATISRPVTVSGTASDLDRVSQVVLSLNGVNLSTANFGYTPVNWSFTLNPADPRVSNGAQTLFVTAVDQENNVSSASIPVTIQYATPAAPVLTSPVEGSSTPANVNITGTVEANITVQLYLNGSPSGLTTQANTNGVFSFLNVSLPILGRNTIQAVASDAKGASDLSNAIHVFLDIGAPNAPVQLTADSLPGGRITLSWTPAASGEPSVSYRVYRATSADQFVAGNLSTASYRVASVTQASYTDLPASDGVYAYAVTALDNVGNEGVQSQPASAVADRVAPAGAIALSSAPPLGPGSYNLTLTMTKPLQAAPIVTFTPSGASANPVFLTADTSSVTVWHGVLPILSNTPTGTGTFALEAKDLVGNVGTTITSGGSVALVTVGPNGTLTLDHASPIKATTVVATLTLDAPAASTPTLAFTPFGGSAIPVALSGGGRNWTGSFAITANTGDGLALFSYSATDAYGNTSTKLFGTTSFTIKTAAPTAPQFLTAVSQAAGAVLLRWSSPTTGAPTSYNVYRGGVLLAAGVLPAADGSGTITDTPAADGTYTYTVSAVDAAGNEGPQTAGVPGVSVRVPPAAPVNLAATINASNQVALTWQAGSSTAPASYNVYRASYAFTSVAGLTPHGVTTPSFFDTIIQNGTYFYGVTALDAAGNESALSATTQVLYNKAPPVIAVTGVTDGGFYNANVSPSFSSNDPTLTSITATLDGQAFSSGGAVSAEGAHQLAVTAVNSGNFSSNKTVNFTIDKTSPTVSIQGVQNGVTYYAAVSATLQASDLNLNATSFLLNGAPYASGTQITQAGNYTLIATATDLAGNSASQTVSFIVVVAPQPPQSLAAVVSDNLVALTWQDSDPRVAGYRVYLNGNLASGSMQAAASYQDNTFALGSAAVYEVTSLDAIGQESARVRLTVPAFTASLAGYGVQGNLVRGFFDTISLSVTNQGAGASTFGPAALTITSTATAASNGQAGAASIGAGQTTALAGVVYTAANAPQAMTLQASLTLPTDPGAAAAYQKTFPITAANPVQPTVELFPDPLILGTNSKVRVKFYNRGSAPADVVTARFNGGSQPVPTLDVKVDLYTSDGFLISEGGIQQTGNGASSFFGANGQIDFVSVPAGGSFIFDPIGVFIPPNLASAGLLTATVSTITYSTAFNPIVGKTGFSGSQQAAAISQPPYTATIRSDRGVYDAQQTVTLTGQAIDTSGHPVPNSPVNIGVNSAGFQRTISTGTDANGNFLAVYNPGPGDVGVFSLSAAYPSVVTNSIQSSFTIVGLSLQYSNVTVNVVQGATAPFTTDIINYGETPEGGFTTTLNNPNSISSIQVTLDTTSVPASVAAGQRAPLRFLVHANANAPTSAQFSFNLTDSHGFSRSINPIQINTAPPQVIPAVTPQTFSIGMLAGASRTQTFSITNNGFATWQGVNLTQPALSWATLNANGALGDIGPGQTVNFSITFNPPANLANGVYNNNNNPIIQIQSANQQPVSIFGGVTITSILQGGLTFHSIDADQARNPVTGAGVGVVGTTVTLTSLDVSGLSFTVYGDANGVASFTNIPSGNYSWRVQANGFNTATGNQTVDPGVNQTLEEVLTHAYVTYTWTVTPTLIQDQYTVKLDLSFLTNVPAPVVTMEPGFINLNMTDGQVAYTQLTITNHGLIAADDFEININNTDPNVVIELPYTTLPELAAGQQVIVPVKITLLHASCHSASMGGGFTYKCIAGVLTKVPVPGPTIAVGSCGTAPSGGGGGAGPAAGGGGGFGLGGFGGSLVGKITGSPPPTPPQKCGRKLVIKAPPKPKKCENCKAGDPVDLGDGSNAVSETDLDVRMPILHGLSLAFTRTYNSHDLGVGALGKSWKHRFEYKLLTLGALAYVYQDPLDGKTYKYGDNISNDSVGVITPSGEHIRFDNNGSGTYLESDFVEGSRVTKNGDGSFTWTRPQHDAVYKFDSLGRLISIADDDGNAASLSYGGNNLLSAVKDPSGRTLYTLSYDASGHLSSVQDVGNRTVNYQVTNGMLSQVSGPDGTAQYSYSGNLMTSEALPTGQTLTWSYTTARSNADLFTPHLYTSGDGCQVVGGSMWGGSGGLNCVADVNQAAYQEWYGVSAPILSQSTSCVSIAKFTVGLQDGGVGSAGFSCGVEVMGGGATMSIGSSQSASTPNNNSNNPALDGSVLTIASQGLSAGFTANYYYDVGRDTQAVLTQDNAGFNVTYLRSTSNGIDAITGLIDQVGNNFSYQLDANGSITSLTHPDGTTDKFTYDSTERLIGGVTARGNTYSLTWNPTFNRFASITEPNGDTTQWTYDSNGNTLSQINALGVTDWTFTYDGQGRQSTRANAYGNKITFQYDANGNWTSGTDALGRTTAYVYDSLGRVTSMTNAKQKTYTLTVDVNGLWTSVTDPLNHSTQLTHRLSDGALTRSVDANGNATNVGRDNEGKITSIANALGQTMTASYDARGNLSHIGKPNGGSVSFSYDGLGRITLAQFADDTISVAYSDAQRTETTENNAAKIVKVYDPEHNVVSVQETDKLDGTVSVVNYTYDKNGNRTGMATPFGSFSYTYDALNRLTTLTDFKNQLYRFGYDQASRLISDTLPDGLVVTYSYDAASQVTGMTASAGSTQILSQTYGYDALRNLTSVTWPTGSRTLTYDDASRLVSVVHPSSTKLPYANESYSYDPGDNRVASHLSASYTYGQANRLQSDAQWTYSYDADGNLITRTAQSSGNQVQYAYDGQDRLVSVKDTASGRLTTYRYDPYGRRLTKTIALGAVSEVWRYTYDGDNILSISIKDVDGSGNATTNVYAFTHDLQLDQPLAVHGAADYYYLQDPFGSIAAIADANGAIAERPEYSGFGSPVFVNTVDGSTSSVSHISGNPYAFAGREWDGDTDLYYFRARYYDPSLGRFLERDPYVIGDDYQYALSSPANLVDPYGLQPNNVGMYNRLSNQVDTVTGMRANHDNNTLAGEEHYTRSKMNVYKYGAPATAALAALWEGWSFAAAGIGAAAYPILGPCKYAAVSKAIKNKYSSNDTNIAVSALIFITGGQAFPEDPMNRADQKFIEIDTDYNGIRDGWQETHQVIPNYHILTGH